MAVNGMVQHGLQIEPQGSTGGHKASLEIPRHRKCGSMLRERFCHCYPVFAGASAPVSRRGLRGESPFPGDARSW